MRSTLRVFLLAAFLLLAFSAQAQDKKGDLEDFADDYGEESDEDSGSDDGADFFLLVILDNLDVFTQLWGGTPGTEFGPFPSFPYAEGEGFMTQTDAFRSYYFNTEFSYNYLDSNLRSYILKWETQFVHRSKLSFDLAIYDEEVARNGFVSHDRLTFYGVRYGYAVFRSQQMIVNLEGGFRGFHRRSGHGGPELALDLQLFPRRPLVIETELAAAYVSNGPLYTIESSAGVMIGRFELLAGMRILKNQSSDLLDGFRVGLRIWY